MIEIPDGDVTWRFDAEFFTSRWTCIWGRGCLGIHEQPTPELGEGCCSIGAEMGDEDEAMLISALAASIAPERWQHHGDAVFSDETRTNTNVVDGACVFFFQVVQHALAPFVEPLQRARCVAGHCVSRDDR